MALKCTTCGKSLVGQDRFVKFKCPSCGEVDITRCYQCKRNSSEYTCKKCNFKGP